MFYLVYLCFTVYSRRLHTGLTVVVGRGQFVAAKVRRWGAGRGPCFQAGCFQGSRQPQPVGHGCWLATGVFGVAPRLASREPVMKLL